MVSQGPQPVPIKESSQTPRIAPALAKGTGWSVASRLGVQAIGLLSTIILARLLVPADFGLVALATTFYSALAAITEFSFDVVLIQEQQMDRAQYDTVWTLSILRNTLLAACLVLSARTIAGFFNDSRMENVVYWLAISTFLGGLENVGIVNFRKDLTFHLDLVFTVIAKLGQFLVTIPLALVWRNYWALVGGIIASAAVRVGLSYLMHNYRPRYSLEKWRDVMHFSKWLLLNNIFGFAYTRSDTFVIGKIAGANSVGVYSIAYDVATLATANFLAPLRRAILPSYSKVSDDLRVLRDSFLRVLEHSMLIGTPLSLGIGLVADPLVRVMLGDQWVGAIPLIEVLSLYGFLWVLGASSGPIFIARAKPHYVAWVQGGMIVAMIPMLVIGVLWAGALGAAWAVTLATGLGTLADVFLIVRLLELPLKRLLMGWWRPVIAAAIMSVPVVELQTYLPLHSTTPELTALLAIVVSAGALVYALSVLLIWLLSGAPDGAERDIVRAMGELRRRPFKRTLG